MNSWLAILIRIFLESAGHRVTACHSGSDERDLFQQRQFALAVIDLSMPMMDGWELSRRLNSISPQFPMLAATAWDVGVEDGRDRSANVSAVLKKPFGMRESTQVVSQVIGLERTAYLSPRNPESQLWSLGSAFYSKPHHRRQL